MFPGPNRSKFLSLIGLAIAMAGIAACRQSSSSGNETSNVVQAPAEEPAATAPLPARPLDRAALLAAVARARSAAAIAGAGEEVERSLDGKQFEVRIRFGCAGPAADIKSADLGWQFDADRHVLKIRATPTVGAADPLIAGLKRPNLEAVEGFWVPRPWLLDAACPAPAPQDGSTASADLKGGAPLQQSTAPKVGIAEFFTAADPRTERRDGRAYEATENVQEGITPGVQGFNLVLSGRLRALDAGRVIHCVPAGTDRAPDCIISARVDRIWFEEPESGRTIAQWSS